MYRWRVRPGRISGEKAKSASAQGAMSVPQRDSADHLYFCFDVIRRGHAHCIESTEGGKLQSRWPASWSVSVCGDATTEYMVSPLPDLDEFR